MESQVTGFSFFLMPDVAYLISLHAKISEILKAGV